MIGPLYSDDSGGYSDYADAKLASPHWLNDAKLDDSAIPLLAYRPVGYPAVIAVAKLAAGPLWPCAVTGLQIVLSLVVFIAIVELGIEICIGLRTAVVAALAAALFQLPYDQAIITDSLNAELHRHCAGGFFARCGRAQPPGQTIGSSWPSGCGFSVQRRAAFPDGHHAAAVAGAVRCDPRRSLGTAVCPRIAGMSVAGVGLCRLRSLELSPPRLFLRRLDSANECAHGNDVCTETDRIFSRRHAARKTRKADSKKLH